MEISGRQLASVAALIVMLLLAGVVHGADVACEKEYSRAEQMRWGLVRGDVSEAAFKKALMAQARCNALHGQSPQASDGAVRSSETRGLFAAYIEAIRRAVSRKWVLPEDQPKAPCAVRITQLPGGDVMAMKVDESCPFDAHGRQTLERAIKLAQPLPYKGYESVWHRVVDVSFEPNRE